MFDQAVVALQKIDRIESAGASRSSGFHDWKRNANVERF
jgi:hypothetical protein